MKRTPWESIDVILEHLFQQGTHRLPDDDPLLLAYNTVQLWYENEGPPVAEFSKEDIRAFFNRKFGPPDGMEAEE